MKKTQRTALKQSACKFCGAGAHEVLREQRPRRRTMVWFRCEACDTCGKSFERLYNDVGDEISLLVEG